MTTQRTADACMVVAAIALAVVIVVAAWLGMVAL